MLPGGSPQTSETGGRIGLAVQGIIGRDAQVIFFCEGKRLTDVDSRRENHQNDSDELGTCSVKLGGRSDSKVRGGLSSSQAKKTRM